MPLPSLFIGFASESERIAQAVQRNLDVVCEVELWTQSSDELSKGTLEKLVDALPRFDFAILVLTADDVVLSRGKRKSSARDNVIFEVGLFMGALGRERTFILCDRTKDIALPSNLAGVITATYALQASGNLIASLGAPCTLIQAAIERLGFREGRVPLTHLRNKIFSFEEIRQLITKTHGRIEREFAPDIVVTMSGAGSIAACYLVHINTRDIPLFVAIPFPKPRKAELERKSSFKAFSSVATTKQWRKLSTAKWDIFLPELLFEFPPGTKVVLFDDRVLSGDSQVKLQKELEAVNYVVKRAAVFSSSKQAALLDWFGATMDEEYEMPWGPKDGRY